MFCTHCGKDIEEHKFCPSCGKQQGSVAPTPPAYPYHQSGYMPPYVPPLYGAQPHLHPYKTRGGMLTFIFVLFILQVIFLPLSFLIFLITAALTPSWATFSVLVSLAIGATPLIYYPMLLFKRDPRFLNIFHITWIVSFVWSVINAVINFATMGATVGGVFGDPVLEAVTIAGTVFGTAMGVAWSVGIFLLWRLYFTRSVRVRTFMGTDKYLTECIFTKNVTPPQPAVPDEPSQQTQGYH